ncbi:MAG TPA: hypothetical protein VKR32_03310 [Puia sp.]|nr:hypothetical protein [Puia sp.]
MKIKAFLTTLTLALTVTGLNAIAAPNIHSDRGDKTQTVKERVAKMTPEQKDARMAEIKVRINEIRDMDKSQLTKVERKELRHELRDMKKEAKQLDPTVIYISGGTVLLIVLLIILL